MISTPDLPRKGCVGREMDIHDIYMQVTHTKPRGLRVLRNHHPHTCQASEEEGRTMRSRWGGQCWCATVLKLDLEMETLGNWAMCVATSKKAALRRLLFLTPLITFLLIETQKLTIDPSEVRNVNNILDRSPACFPLLLSYVHCFWSYLLYLL